MEPAYSYRWANGVVENLIRKYPRASEDVLRFLDITERDLAHYLAISDPIYPKIRDLVHFCENWRNSANFPGWTPEMLDSFRYLAKLRMPERITKRLDKVGICIILKEQVPRGARAKSASDES